jgi:signal transduction histidine kinase
MRVVEHLDERFPDVPPGPWSDPPQTAAVIPIPSARPDQLAGVLVAGVSARLAWGAAYRRFFEMMAAPIATAIANARAYEEERRRAEALAALDRAKTAFFSNVSHEFRTPLTLLLGPVEDALARSADPDQKGRLELAHRNALRLQKLVNTLLDFSRIEAGRIQAVYEPTDLAALTAELASVFRSAIERAGLRLIVTSEPLPEPVAAEPSWSCSRILVVDDSVDTARGMARLLKLLGHDVRMAHDGPSAIDEARDHRPDVILLDLGLPRDGRVPGRPEVAGRGLRPDSDRRSVGLR